MGLEVSTLVLFLLLTFVFGMNAAGDIFEGFEDPEFERGAPSTFVHVQNKQVSAHWSWKICKRSSIDTSDGLN